MSKKTDKVPDIRSVVSTTPSTLPELDDLTFKTVKNALDLYFDLKEGKAVDKNSLIEKLALAAHYAYEEVEYWYDIALRLEKQGKVNANIREHNAIYKKEKNERAGKAKGGGSTPFRKYEKIIQSELEEYDLAARPRKITLETVRRNIKAKTGIEPTKDNIKDWRKYYINSGKKWIFKPN